MNKQAIWIGAAATAGVLAGYVAASATDGLASGIRLGTPAQIAQNPASSARPVSLEAVSEKLEGLGVLVDSLSALLEQEIEERRWLQDEIYELQEQISRLHPAQAESPADAGAPESSSRRRAAATARRFGANVSVDTFVKGGFDPVQAEMLKRRTDEAMLARLYLRDQASREGWLNTQRYFDEVRKLPNNENALRSELGEQDYDRYLYALGRPNRVEIMSVMENSAAQKAGIQEGDILYRYDGQRLYSRREVGPFTRSGDSGELIPVEVMRGSQRVQLYIPRGPLGVQLSSSSVEP